MLFTIIETVVYVLMVFILAIPVASLLSTAKALLNGRYLNRYFVISHKGSGIYELHNNPAFGYYKARPAKFYALHDDAVRKFKNMYPDTTLYTVTSTLHAYYVLQGLVGTMVLESRFKRSVSTFLNIFLILRNMANYRLRTDREWQFVYLIRRVRQTIPLRYFFSGGADFE
jgi:hypothetical protein